MFLGGAFWTDGSEVSKFIISNASETKMYVCVHLCVCVYTCVCICVFIERGKQMRKIHGEGYMVFTVLFFQPFCRFE